MSDQIDRAAEVLSGALGDEFSAAATRLLARRLDAAGLLASSEHDRQVAARTLREAAGNVRASSFWNDGSDNYADRVRAFIGSEADRIEREAGERDE